MVNGEGISCGLYLSGKYRGRLLGDARGGGGSGGGAYLVLVT